MKAKHQLDEYWYHLRIKDSELPGRHLLRMQQYTPTGCSFLPTRSSSESTSISLSDAVAVFLRLKGQNRPLTFSRAAERASGYVIDVCGDKDLLTYSKADATRFRDALIERNLTGSSITRIFGTVKSVVNFAASQVGLTMTNPFTGVYFDQKSGVQERAPLPLHVIKQVQRECLKIDDDLRWLVALVSDTGLRLAEAAGLLREDIVINAKVPHVVARAHSWRRLKTPTSNREVPLVGMSLWAAKRIHGQSGDSPFVFVRYNRGNVTKANAASAALNKWMRPLVPDRCTMHSFRH